MPDRLPKTLSCKSAQKLLEEYGWSRTEGGKHGVKMERDGCRPITLPMHKGQEYGKRLTAAILREAELK